MVPGGVLIGNRGVGDGGTCRCGLRKSRKSSAMSLAVVYRSDARFDERLQADPFQFLGDRVVDLTGGRGSVVLIDSMISRSESPRNGLLPVNNS